MSKELIERLRDSESRDCCSQITEAADRIEELERELEAFKAHAEKLSTWLTATRIERDAYKIADHYNSKHDALLADNERLRDALEKVVRFWDSITMEDCVNDIHVEARKALAATPEQSLARIRKQVREECAELAEKEDSYCFAAAIRAMKEPE